MEIGGNSINQPATIETKNNALSFIELSPDEGIYSFNHAIVYVAKGPLPQEALDRLPEI